MKPNLSLSELLGWDGASPLRADLHCHSTISDGSFTSAELLAQAQAAGLTHLAITNHDTTAGFDDAAAAAQALSAVPSNEGSAVITYVSGIEISAWNPVSERKVHILGFGLKENSPAIAALCGPTLRARTENTAWQQEQLEKAGYSLDYELLKSCVRHQQVFTNSILWQHSQWLLLRVRNTKRSIKAYLKVKVYVNAISSTSMRVMRLPQSLKMVAWRCWRIPDNWTATIWCLR